MKREYACNLDVGDTINLHPSLAVQKARVIGIKPIVTKAGTVLIFDLESCSGAWTGAKATFGFLANEKVEYIPQKKTLSERFWAFVNFFNFTR
jgi:hypothetical protein